MSKRTKLNMAEVLIVMRHLADVAGMKADVSAQRQLLIDGLNRLIGTSQGFFFVADAWKQGMQSRWTHFTLSTHFDPVATRYMGELGAKLPITADPYCDGSMGNMSPLVSIARSEAISGTARRPQFSAFRDVDQTIRAKDGLINFHRMGPDGSRIVGFAMHRFGAAERPINPIESAMLRLAVVEVKGMVDRGLLPLPSMDRQKTLPPRLKQVLDLLLSGKSPKRIAWELSLSVHTVREHITRLYRHFKVTGRDELMAEFIH